LYGLQIALELRGACNQKIDPRTRHRDELGAIAAGLSTSLERRQCLLTLDQVKGKAVALLGQPSNVLAKVLGSCHIVSWNGLCIPYCRISFVHSPAEVFACLSEASVKIGPFVQQ
jgi:hypothetical protein